MLKIGCPWCGARDEPEFVYGGEAHIVMPTQPDTVGDSAWADYLYMRSNTKGPHRERWFHLHGCRRWFNVVRDTRDERVIAVYAPGSEPS